jgi:hypothetical protein
MKQQVNALRLTGSASPSVPIPARECHLPVVLVKRF